MQQTEMKFDQGKVRPSLVLSAMNRALTHVCDIGEYGCEKYEIHSWIKVPDARVRYEDALLRHYMAYTSGEERDPESGRLHLSHLAWNALAILDLYLRENEDARPERAGRTGPEDSRDPRP